MNLTLEDINSIIATDEHRTLELKKTTGELNVGMHTACAFLNTDGGWLVFGVSPKSLKIVGQQVTDNTQQEIATALAGIQPAVDIRVHYLSLNGDTDSPNSNGPDDNKLIAMYFPPFQTGCRPYTFHGCPYHRVESTTRVMPREVFDERLRQSNPYLFAWEKQPAEGISLDDISEVRLRGALRLGVSSGRVLPGVETEPKETLLNKLRLLTPDGRPNNAAALLFGSQTTCYPQFKLRMARFRGESKNAFDDLQMAEGNFFELLDAGMSFFVKHLPIKADVVGFRREEQLEIPAAALREALVNALCHRQWERYNLSVGIAIYDDRIEIENPGLLPPPITPDNIKQAHLSYPYNSIIADVLYKTTYLEQWGSGVQRILQACRNQNIKNPVWNVQGGFVTVTFFRKSNNSLDNRFDNRLDNQIGNSIDNNPPNKSLDNRLDSSLDNQIDDSLDNNPPNKSLDNSFDNRLDNSLDNQIDNSIDNNPSKKFLDNSLDNSLDNQIDNSLDNNQPNKSLDNRLDNSLGNNLPNDSLDNSLDNLSEKQRMVLCLMKEDPHITASVLAEKIGVSRNTVNRINSQLKQKGLITREGGKKKGHWVVHVD